MCCCLFSRCLNKILSGNLWKPGEIIYITQFGWVIQVGSIQKYNECCCVIFDAAFLYFGISSCGRTETLYDVKVVQIVRQTGIVRLGFPLSTGLFVLFLSNFFCVTPLGCKSAALVTFLTTLMGAGIYPCLGKLCCCGICLHLASTRCWCHSPGCCSHLVWAMDGRSKLYQKGQAISWWEGFFFLVDEWSDKVLVAWQH